MSLKEQLEGIRNNANPPKEAAQVMKRTTVGLIESGQAEKAPRPGQKAPAFELPNIYGDMVNSERMLEKGPLVVHFYRGGW